MRTRLFRLTLTLFIAAAVLLGCKTTSLQLPTPAESNTVASTPGPVRITGEFTYSNDFVVETYYYEQAVALVDLHGFVLRDEEWEIPVDSQTLGFLQVDPSANRGSYRLDLPSQPRATFNDVDNDRSRDRGVQIFAVAYWPNLAGGPYSEGDDRSLGWPSYLTSMTTDSENQDEITGGALVVWAPDDQQQFSTGFGPDGLLFTSDDPVGPIQAGYTVVDLNQKPFGLLRDEEPSLKLYEPTDVATKDFASLSYNEAFDKMFAIVKKEYAFNGISGKQPDWDALYSRISPLVKEAEVKNDAMAYYLALRDFTNAFKDGHVGLDGGSAADQYFTEQTAGGYGFAIRELDDGKVIVTHVVAGGPAEQAGMQVSAEISQFNGQPIREAIAAVNPLGGPYSTDFGLRYQQARYLLRAPLNTTIKVTFANPKAEPKEVELTAVEERESFGVSSLFLGYDPNALPVEFRILESGIGYIKINTNDDDLNLMVRLFERALKTFQANQLPGLIIDMRQNTGGSPLGLAGFLTDQEIPLGQLEYYSEKTGKFEPEGPRGKFTPNTVQYPFDRMALLVGQACYSACEIESYGFSQVQGMIVVGQYPTAGVEAEVARGQFLLPEGMSLQVPTGRFTLPDGSIFLEGQGVQPTLRLPIDQEAALSGADVVLQAAEQELTKP